MNIKNITVGILAVSLAIGGIFVKFNSNENQSVYTPRNFNNGVRGNAGYAEYMHMLKADPTTGKINYNLVNEVRNQMLAKNKQNNKAALNLNWEHKGPDNVGGRTRAILVDKNNSNIIYAGSVSGGLFVSTDGSLTWSQVADHNGLDATNMMVSCITQTDNGRIFFGTGSQFEGVDSNGVSGNGNIGGFDGHHFIGDGVYEYVPSSGDVLPVLTTGNIPNNNAGDALSYINSIAAKGNRLYIGSTNGMIWADANGSGIYPTTFSGWTNPIEESTGVLEINPCQDIDIASDGSMLVCFSDKAYVSNSDAFGSFTKINKSGSRLVGAIAPSNPNVMYLLRANNRLISFDISTDKGASWDVIVPGGSGCVDPFRLDNCDTLHAQGGFTGALAVNPSDWGHVLVGGVQLYEWRHTVGSSPIGGDWIKTANLFPSPMNPYYVHADKHTIVWPTTSNVFIGCDGGVFKSSDAGTTWQARNYGYNVTSFYDVAVAANGLLLGGAQDNGTQLGGFGGMGTPLGTIEIMDGDGFDCAFSNFSAGIAYTTSSNGLLVRSGTGGTATEFYDFTLDNLIHPTPPAQTKEPFHTVITNWEHGKDSLSVDSIEFIFNDTVPVVIAPGDSVLAGETILAGTTIYYTSLTNGIELSYVVPADIVLDSIADTLKFVDPIQNKLALATTKGVFLTRDAARLNVLDAEWFNVEKSITVDPGTSTVVECMEFSADGNHLFIGYSTGQLYRVSNLSMGNTENALDISNTVTTSLDPDSNRVTTVDSIGYFPGVITGIAADPKNLENLIVTVGGYTTSDHVFRSTNAITATSPIGTFEAIQGSGLPYMPVYDAEIDFTDNDKVIIGTEWGVWASDNAFSAGAGSVTWSDESGNGMTHVPVFGVVQQHIHFPHSINPGYLYLGTHGRGFYMSTDLFTAIEENDFSDLEDGNSFISNLNVYPNPLNNVGMLAFDLKQKSNAKVKIYNLSGSLVKTIDLGHMAKGNHKEQFDASSLSVGSYILSLETGAERSVAKFMVTR
jgi:hypothetical protein